MKTFGKKVNEFVQAYTIVIILAIMIIFLSFNSDSFLTVGNFLNLFLQANLYGIMALGVGVLMINGYFDLSVGMIMSLSANLVIMMSGINIWLGIVISLVSGVLCGLINSICRGNSAHPLWCAAHHWWQGSVSPQDNNGDRTTRTHADENMAMEMMLRM